MTAVHTLAADPVAASVRPPAPEEAWRKALARFEAGQVRAERASKVHSEADEAMFAARAELEAIKPPASLTVQTDCELYFSDGMRTPVERQYASDVELRDEDAINAYAKDDDAVRQFLFAELKAWHERRAPVEAAYEKAKAASVAREAASMAAMTRSDKLQLRLLQTPSPSLREFLWKIEQLRKQDCCAYTEELGWGCVMEELARMAGAIPSSSSKLN